MVTINIKAKKFDGKGNFNMWRINIRVLLVLQKCIKTLGGYMALSSTFSPDHKKELLDTVYYTIILHLIDNILKLVRKISL